MNFKSLKQGTNQGKTCILDHSIKSNYPAVHHLNESFATFLRFDKINDSYGFFHQTDKMLIIKTSAFIFQENVANKLFQ